MPNCVVLKYQFNDEQFSLVEGSDVNIELKYRFLDIVINLYLDFLIII